MTRYLLDTNMLSRFVNRRLGVDTKVRSTWTRGAVIGTMPVVAELFYGLELIATCEINRPKLVRGLEQIRCWPFERSAAEEYGRLAAKLRRIGRDMQQIDIVKHPIAKVRGFLAAI